MCDRLTSALQTFNVCFFLPIFLPTKFLRVLLNHRFQTILRVCEVLQDESRSYKIRSNIIRSTMRKDITYQTLEVCNICRESLVSSTVEFNWCKNSPVFYRGDNISTLYPWPRRNGQSFSCSCSHRIPSRPNSICFSSFLGALCRCYVTCCLLATSPRPPLF